MEAIGAWLTGGRAFLFARNLVLWALNRPRLQVSASQPRMWEGDGTPLPAALAVTVKNPSPHSLAIESVGVELDGGRQIVFPNALEKIAGPIDGFRTAIAVIRVQELDQFMADLDVPVETRNGLIRVHVSDGLGKTWTSKRFRLKRDASAH